MQVNDVIHGFQVIRSRECRELNGTLWELRHTETGAQLCWMDNGEENRLFSVAFKTLPWDDTGVFHILEHSVLGGSESYPVKEPFLDLLKSSMNTFLNAMTFSDKTMYPVSSRNVQDFMNLTRVYLDAVFRPAIRYNPNIFRQEGWHYELREGDAVPVYKGVVFNEMKGALASVDGAAELYMKRMLYPDNCYRFESGGDPEHIPELTQEDFLAAYEKFYHPSNARFWLDGDVPLEQTLEMIGSYLAGRGKGVPVPDIPCQEPVAASRMTVSYPIGRDEEEARKTCVVLGRIAGGWQDRRKLLAASLVGSYLTSSNEAPLKQAILQSGLAQDVSLELDDSVAQPACALMIRNTEEKHVPALRQLIRDVAEKLLKEGMDREELAAELNQMAFRMKENREPRGLIRNIIALTPWLHGGDPMEWLTCDDLLRRMREDLDTDYYADILREMLLDDAHTAELVLVPSRTLGDDKRRAEEARLQAAMEAWTAEEKQRIIRENAELDAWQATPDTPEQTATLPVLSLNDVSPDPQWTETIRDEHAGAELLFHPMETQGIIHGTLYFSLSDQALSDMSALSFAADLYGQLPTGKHTVKELKREIKRHIGRLNFGTCVYPILGRPEACRPFLTASFSVLEESLPKALPLVAEILNDTRFDDAAAVRDLLNQYTEDTYRAILQSGSSYAVSRVQAGFSAHGAVTEKTGGFDRYLYMKDLKENFDAGFDGFRVLAERLEREIAVSARLTLSHTASRCCGEIRDIIPLLSRGHAAPAELCLETGGCCGKEAIVIPADISFAAAGTHLSLYDRPFTGGLQVLCNLLTYGYLWNEVRVKGGAYGCGFRAGRTGGICFYSYRDPSPVHSLQVFRETDRFIRGFCDGDEALDKYIIGSIAAGEPLLGPDQMGRNADSQYLSGMDRASAVRLRSEMLALTRDDLASLIPLFGEMADRSAQCIVGSENALKELDGDWTRRSV